MSLSWNMFLSLQVIVKNLSSGTRVVLKSHYGYEVLFFLKLHEIWNMCVEWIMESDVSEQISLKSQHQEFWQLNLSFSLKKQSLWKKSQNSKISHFVITHTLNYEQSSLFSVSSLSEKKQKVRERSHTNETKGGD